MYNGRRPQERPGVPGRVGGNPVWGAQHASTSRIDNRPSHPIATTYSSQSGAHSIRDQRAMEDSTWFSHHHHHHHQGTDGWDAYGHRSPYGQSAPQMAADPTSYGRQLAQGEHMPDPYSYGQPQMIFDVPPSAASVSSWNSPVPGTRETMTSTYAARSPQAPNPFLDSHTSPSTMYAPSQIVLPSQNLHFLSPNTRPPYPPAPFVASGADQRPLAMPGRSPYGAAIPGFTPNPPWERDSAPRAVSMPPSSRQPPYPTAEVSYGLQEASQHTRSGVRWSYHSQPPSHGPSPPPSNPTSPPRGQSTAPMAATSQDYLSHPQRPPLPSSAILSQSSFFSSPYSPPPHLTGAQDGATSCPGSPGLWPHRRPKGKVGTRGAALPVASAPSMAEMTSPSRSAANRGGNPEKAESSMLRASAHNPRSYDPDHQWAATPSQQPSIAPSIGPAPSPVHWAQDLSSSTLTRSITTGGSSYFQGASDFNIESQNIQNTNIGSQNIHNTNLTPSRTVFEHLCEHIVHGAAHDSNERCDAPACHEETRVAIRQNIMGWITHGDRAPEPKRIMWLSGPAGGGKTAIAGSVAEACKKEGLLAGTFMFSSFSGSPGRMSKRGVIITLAYHMSQHKALRSFATQLLRALEEHQDIYHKQLKEQAECLILAPFRSINEQDRTGWPSAIIVDGLDEVVAAQHRDPTGRQPPRTSEQDQVEILEVLLILSQSPSFPFRIFISSRPERNITNFFAAAEVQSLTDKLFLDSKYNPDTDIKLFLVSKFAEIRRRGGISDTWPGEDTLGQLVEMSSGQFIVPTTVMRWVGVGIPQRRLDEVLNLQKEITASKNPFASLDTLYRHILLRACDPDDDPRLIMKWILVIQCWKNIALPSTSVVVWRHFLQDTEGEFNYRMGQLASLISIPPLDEAPISFYHKSLADFLLAKSRCGDDLYVDDTDMYPFIAQRLLQTFKKKQVDVPFPLPDSRLGHFAELVVISNYRLSKYEKKKGIMKGFLLYEPPTPGSKAALSR